jgi:hypothetical protein
MLREKRKCKNEKEEKVEGDEMNEKRGRGRYGTGEGGVRDLEERRGREWGLGWCGGGIRKKGVMQRAENGGSVGIENRRE